MNATFDHAAAESTQITSYYFKPDFEFSFTAGQFIELTVAHLNPDKAGQRRWFTISSAPGEALLRITTRHRFDGSDSSFKKALTELLPGTQVLISEAMGDFVFPKLLQTPIVFVAGGIGITPVISMLTWAADRGETRSIKLLQAVRTEDDIIFQEVFERAHLHATIVVNQPSSFWGGERGVLDAEMVLGIETPDPATLYYISGPEKMVEAMESGLKKSGIDRAHIVGDHFDGYTAI